MSNAPAMYAYGEFENKHGLSHSTQALTHTYNFGLNDSVMPALHKKSIIPPLSKTGKI